MTTLKQLKEMTHQVILSKDTPAGVHPILRHGATATGPATFTLGLKPGETRGPHHDVHHKTVADAVSASIKHNS